MPHIDCPFKFTATDQSTFQSNCSVDCRSSAQLIRAINVTAECDDGGPSKRSVALSAAEYERQAMSESRDIARRRGVDGKMAFKLTSYTGDRHKQFRPSSVLGNAGTPRRAEAR